MRRYILTVLCAVVALASLVARAQAATGGPVASVPDRRHEQNVDDRHDRDFDEGQGRDSDDRYTLAVVGDMPYGDAKIAAFPGFIDFVNQDRSVEAVVHLGDINSGSWDNTGGNSHATLSAFDPLVEAIGDAARAFDKPVLMLLGDSHVYTEDHPYDGSPRFTDLHPGYTPIAPNLTRIVVEGSTTVPNRFEYVRLKVDPTSAPVFSWERVDYTFAP